MDTVHRGESKLSCRIMNVHRAVGHDFGRYLVLLNTDRWIDRPTFQEHPTAGTCQCRFLSSLAAKLGAWVRGNSALLVKRFSCHRP